MVFGKISEIDIKQAHSFNKIFLTFDIDWASDEVLEYCINMVEQTGLKATWFATHKTLLLQRIKDNPLFDLGIHPNFNPLLEGDFCYGKNYKEVLLHFLDIVPDAKIMRSHCLGISSRILMEARALGITHESNLCIPLMAGGAVLKPFVNWDGLIRCPYHYADDVACMYANKINISNALKEQEYFMFGFHPIHIFLNTESLKRYENAKIYAKNAEKLAQMRGDSDLGACNVFNEIVSL